MSTGKRFKPLFWTKCSEAPIFRCKIYSGAVMNKEPQPENKSVATIQCDDLINFQIAFGLGDQSMQLHGAKIYLKSY
jgi:hypothetical protein